MPGAALYFEDVAIGDEIGPVERTISDEQVLQYVSLAGGDLRQGRFTDAAVAQGEGLPDAIVPGPMNIAILGQLLTGWSPTVILKKLDVVFRQVVLHNVPLQLKGIVTHKEAVSGEGRVECDVFLQNDEGENLVGGSATLILPIKGR